MRKKIIINGGTGLIGKHFINEALNRDYHPIILTRNKQKAEKEFSGIKDKTIKEFKLYSVNRSIIDEFNRAEAVINFAGASISKRKWTDDYKKILISSRVDTTKSLIEVLKNCDSKPKVFINMSAIGYYGYKTGVVATEDTPSGEGFISDLCVKWENAAFEAKELGIRTVVLRAGIVLTKKGGALGRMIPVFKLFLGGVLGSGEQWMPWIHINDLVNLIFYAIENNNIEGPLNATSPHQVTNREFTKTLAKVLKRPAVFKVPSFVLKLVLGDFSINVLEGIKVLPQKTLSTGFKFKYSELEPALNNLLLE